MLEYKDILFNWQMKQSKKTKQNKTKQNKTKQNKKKQQQQQQQQQNKRSAGLPMSTESTKEHYRWKVQCSQLSRTRQIICDALQQKVP